MMKKDDFEQLVSEAIKTLPPIGKKMMKNVVFLIESEIRPERINEIKIKKGEMLLGLYEGISKLNRGTNYTWVLPDKITIFQEPIEKLANNDPERIKNIVYEVVRHEVGHHLGFDEKGIREYEAKQSKKVIKN
jgi:predicted Zn-dependent protease with MMP-like domain